MKKIKTLIKKEIIDILRDRKTLIMMIAVPLLLYPLIIIGMTLIMTMYMQNQNEKIYSVGMSAQYADFAENLEQIYQENHEEDDIDLVFVYAQPGEEQQMQETADVWMDISAEASEYAAGGSKTSIKLVYASTNQGASSVCTEVEELLDQYREELVIQKLVQSGMDKETLYPITYEAENTASLSESLGMDIGGSIGMMLIVTIMLGAVYPAIDATAGEKERGTLETMLTLPVTNFQLIASKYISVALFASVTAVISILSLGGSILFLICGVAGEEMETAQLFDFGGILKMLPIMIVVMIATALLISALCMCFCVFAKSFKEANNFVTPLMLIVMFASMAAMIPSINLDYQTALIPIVNVSLMVKQIIGQQFEFGLAGITILTNIGYSVLIVWILAKIYNSEDILFTDGFKSIRLFRPRTEIRPGTVPAVGDLIIGTIVLLLLYLYVGIVAGAKLGFAANVVVQLLVLAVPLVITWYMKSDVKQLFWLRRPVWKKVPGALLLSIGIWCINIALGAGTTSTYTESAQKLEETFGAIMEQPVWALILVIAVMPAICEEIMFRGFLFGSLGRKIKAQWAIIISAVVFAAYHMSLVKMLPMSLLGIGLAAAMSATGSIYTSMAMHFLNNLISVLIMKYPEQVGKYLPFLAAEQLELSWIIGLVVIGALCTAAGIWILRSRKRAVQ